MFVAMGLPPALCDAAAHSRQDGVVHHCTYHDNAAIGAAITFSSNVAQAPAREFASACEALRGYPASSLLRTSLGFTHHAATLPISSGNCAKLSGGALRWAAGRGGAAAALEQTADRKVVLACGKPGRFANLYMPPASHILAKLWALNAHLNTPALLPSCAGVCKLTVTIFKGSPLCTHSR